ncbi:TatD family hydrolase [Microbulbifer sp. THAF38]|uniref:TatD family hydrolase n=1 Tax=Microbulbifer sp. THAF38 TaxID=2587856 RepID=UPI0012692618|nr:TatD family hydrolase [Microbulbifer sp. THAF38]QFT55503.1 putative deoxyribonuclease YjjV [Microbulbifer sp. THAF38]
MKLIDSHCHFDFDIFEPDRAQVWQRCTDAGINQLIIPGVCISQWQRLAHLVDNQPQWHAAAGVHPWWVSKNCEEERDYRGEAELGRVLAEHLKQNQCVAVGECGLDAAIATPLESQMAVFKIQLEVASDLQLPLILHVHRAHNEVLKLLKQYHLPRGGVVHAFSGSEQMAMEYWKMGFYLGVGGTITYSRAAKTRRTVARVPLESLILESDAPDMPLSGRQGQRNSPENLPLIAAELAALRDISLQEVATATRKNTEMLFSL